MDNKTKEEIKKLAYYNWENRKKLNISGDSSTDWFAAEQAVIHNNKKFLASQPCLETICKPTITVTTSKVVKKQRTKKKVHQNEPSK